MSPRIFCKGRKKVNLEVPKGALKHSLALIFLPVWLEKVVVLWCRCSFCDDHESLFFALDFELRLRLLKKIGSRRRWGRKRESRNVWKKSWNGLNGSSKESCTQPWLLYFFRIPAKAKANPKPPAKVRIQCALSHRFIMFKIHLESFFFGVSPSINCLLMWAMPMAVQGITDQKLNPDAK